VYGVHRAVAGIYEYSYNPFLMKPIRFLGTVHRDLAAFPELARRQAGYELFMVQVGRYQQTSSRFRPLDLERMRFGYEVSPVRSALCT
jgi:hypothetical protein